jgi:hypothetical protein
MSNTIIDANGKRFLIGAPLVLPAGTELHSLDFRHVPGVNGDGVTDDAPAIQRALDAMVEREEPLVVLAQETLKNAEGS